MIGLSTMNLMMFRHVYPIMALVHSGPHPATPGQKMFGAIIGVSLLVAAYAFGIFYLQYAWKSKIERTAIVSIAAVMVGFPLVYLIDWPEIWVISGLVAVACGHIARHKKKRNYLAHCTGATLGMWLGYILAALGLFAFVVTRF